MVISLQQMPHCPLVDKLSLINGKMQIYDYEMFFVSISTKIVIFLKKMTKLY